MRKIKYTSQFKRDYKREKRGSHSKDLEGILSKAIDLLVNDLDLPRSFCDHALTGKWKGFRDCHLKPDLVLIYRKEKKEFLELVRLASHSELGF